MEQPYGARKSPLQETQIISIQVRQQPERESTATADHAAAVWISSQVYRPAAFGAHHPRSIPRRGGSSWTSVRMLGWLER